MESRFLLDVVVTEGSSVLELLSCKDEPLLIRRNTFLVLDFGLHVLNRIAGLDLESDGLAGKSLYEDLHTAPEPKDQVESRFLLDVVVTEGSSVLELLSGKDEPLLIGRNTFLVLDFGLHVLNRIAGLDLESDGLAGKSLYEDLHTAPEPKDQVESRFLLDVVVTEGSSVLELLSGKDEPLLIGRNTFLVLDFGLHVLNRIARLDLESDGLAGKSLYENLHTAPEPKDQVESRFLLDVVVTEGSSVLELLSGKDEPLLIGRNTFLVLDFGLHVLNRIAGLDLESDGLAGKSLYEDLHTAPEPKDQVESRFLLDVVVTEGSSVLELLSCKDEPLLIGRNTFLVLDFGLHVLNRIAGLDLESDGLAGKSLYEDLHTAPEPKDQVESRFLLDVVVTEGSSVLELLSGKDEPLLIGRNTFLVLDFGLHVLNRIARLDLESDGLAGKSLYEDLHNLLRKRSWILTFVVFEFWLDVVNAAIKR